MNSLQHNKKGLGAILRKKRTALRLTRKEIGDYCKVSGNLVAKWETGMREPKAITLIKLIRLLGIKKRELLDVVAVEPEEREQRQKWTHLRMKILISGGESRSAADDG